MLRVARDSVAAVQQAAVPTFPPLLPLVLLQAPSPDDHAKKPKATPPLALLREVNALVLMDDEDPSPECAVPLAEEVSQGALSSQRDVDQGK